VKVTLFLVGNPQIFNARFRTSSATYSALTFVRTNKGTFPDMIRTALLDHVMLSCVLECT